MFNCPLCRKTFDYASNFDRHMVTHTKEKPYKCLSCPAAFGVEDMLKRHTKTVHDGVKLVAKKNTRCTLCSFKCRSKFDLKIHLRKHSTQFPFSCDVPDCQFKTKYEKNLQKHFLNIHTVDTVERPYECPFDGCSYKGKTTTDLKRHLKSHSEEKPFTCNVQACNYTCKRKAYLKYHISIVHSQEKLFKCSTCDFRTKTSLSLSQHRLTHKMIKRFKCQAPNCSYASQHRQHLQLHFDRKHRKKNVICTEYGCNFKCGSITLLKTHLRNHQRPLLKCPEGSCSFSIKRKQTLLKHISLKHKSLQSATVVEQKKFNLQIAGTPHAPDTLHCRFSNCGYQTKVQRHYDRHRITHNKEEKRKHVCAFCFSRVRNLFELKSHLQGHVGEKPYSCSQCEYTTADGYRLRKHADRIHHIQLVPLGKEDEVRKCRTCGRNCFSYSEFVLHSMSHLNAVVVLERLHVRCM